MACGTGYRQQWYRPPLGSAAPVKQVQRSAGTAVEDIFNNGMSLQRVHFLALPESEQLAPVIRRVAWFCLTKEWESEPYVQIEAGSLVQAMGPIFKS